MLKQIYYKNLPCGVGAPTLVTLPIQVLGLKVGEETPQNIDFADITNLKVRLKKSGSTGVGVDLTTEGVEKYEVSGNAITILLTTRKKDDIDEVSIVGQYGNVGVYAVIKLFYKSGQNEFVLNPYIIRVTDAGEGGGTGGGGIIEGTYAEIKALRDSGGLSVGSWYRITDFVTTTTQENTQSAQHPFDVLVLATDVNQFSEHARAMHHVGDTYFSTANIEAWDIWYCFDNDTNRFKWADDENGKGVIWRMVDEWGNDCPYDFKNILFFASADYNAGFYAYTFNWYDNGTSMDASVFGNDGMLLNDEGQIGGVYGNTMSAYYSYDDYPENPTSTRQWLNGNIFLSDSEYDGGCYYGCYSNTFGNDCYSNTFGNNCYSNTFGNNCYFNTFGNDYYSNTFGNDCDSNTFGDYCNRNTFGYGCYSNTFGDGCYSNTFGNNCYSNTFGDYCYSNTFGDYYYSNTFGNDCYSNTFGDGCYSNTFGNNCYFNTFGNDCYSNTFGTSETILKAYMRYITIESGVQYCNITCSATTSSSMYCQNVHINSGVNNTTTRKTITIPTAGNTFLTTVGTANDTKINV